MEIDTVALREEMAAQCTPLSFLSPALVHFNTVYMKGEKDKVTQLFRG